MIFLRLLATILFCAELSSSLFIPKVRSFDEPFDKCQLKLYAVEEYLVPNESIDTNIAARKDRRDKSMETIGKPSWQQLFGKTWNWVSK